MVAATLTSTIARSCSGGALKAVCGCQKVHDSKVQEATDAFDKMNVTAATVNADRWVWGKCSGNIQYALRFVKNFADKLENTATKRGRMAIFNFAKGRQVRTTSFFLGKGWRC